MGELSSSLLKPLPEGDSPGPRHQHAEGDCLCVSVGETLIGCVWEEQLAPVGCQRSECFALEFELFCDFVAQKPTETRSRVGQIPCTLGRDRFPPEEGLKQRHQ